MTAPVAIESYPAPCVEIRPMTEADRSYVVSTWLRSFWPAANARGREFGHRIQADYLRTYDQRVKAALLAGTRVSVAVDPKFPRAIAGWIAHTGTTLHYVYVRKELRRQGVARALLASTPGLWAHSHLTSDLKHLLASGVLATVYRPNHFTSHTSAAESRTEVACKP